MASLNKVFLIGHLGDNPNKVTEDAVTISVATSESWKDKITGEKKELTEWHRVIFFGKLAPIANQYLKKGSHIHIEGSLQTRKYIKDGVEKYSTNIKAHAFKVLDKKPTSVESSKPNPYAVATGGTVLAEMHREFNDDDDDLPF